MLALLLTAVAACGAAPGAPTDRSPVSLTATATRTTLSAGESTTVTFTVRNVSARTVRIDLPDSCLVQPRVVDSAGKDLPGFGLVCAAVISSVTLAPNESRDVPYRLRAGAGAGTLQRGTYRVHGKLNDRVYQVASAPLTITVK